MHKTLLNRLVLALDISIHDSRLLIAEYGPDSENPEGKPKIKNSVREQDGTYYIPGSTIKGNFRSRAEYIANFINSGLGSCHLFSTEIDSNRLDERLSCASRFDIRQKAEQEIASYQFFKQACPICQLFGHSFLKSRIAFSDFRLTRGLKRSRQTHIAVDRATGGGVSGKLFELPYLLEGTFSGKIVLENFQIWQVGLLGFLLRDLNDGLIRFGHRQSTGSGRMKIESYTCQLRMLRSQSDAPEKVNGIMAMSDAVSETYRPPYDDLSDAIDASPFDWHQAQIWVESENDFEGDDSEGVVESSVLFKESLQETHHYLKSFRYPQAMHITGLQSFVDDITERERA
jgi:CRISPR/Cas system CSM-associated protein Csm3 (group 7 of RAMP superfamily)